MLGQDTAQAARPEPAKHALDRFAVAVIQCSLTGSTIIEKGVMEKFVQYSILVEVMQDRTSNCISSWTVEHRFSEFQRLDEGVRILLLRVGAGRFV